MQRPMVLMVMVAALGGALAGTSSGAARAPGEPTARQVIAGNTEAAVREISVAGTHDVEAPQGGILDPDLGTAFFTVIIFLVLLGILGMTAWKPILGGLKSREKAIRDSIEAAQRAREQADASGRELEAKMAEVQRQSALQLTQAKADAVKVAEAIRLQAETDAASLKDRTLREIEAAKQQALTDINSHAAELGTAVARKILQRDVTVSDQQRLVEESLAEMARKN